jgi:hypothetical protein
MPYISRSGNELVIDCSSRPPGMARAVEVELFKVEIEEGDRIRVVNIHTLPPDCWANIGTFAALKAVWDAGKAAAFTCDKPPPILMLVFQTLGMQFTTTDGAAVTPQAS